ncbi:MAG: hypothetical protein HEEMFOPI_01919 [Holosporales bacterium]
MTCFKTQVLKTMRYLILNQEEETAVLEAEEKRSYQDGIFIKCLRAVTINGFCGVIYEIVNKKEESVDLKEDSFYISGDLALSFKVDKLLKNQKTYLYAVRS